MDQLVYWVKKKKMRIAELNDNPRIIIDLPPILSGSRPTTKSVKVRWLFPL